MRVNLGCGQAYMPGWVNVDPSPDVKADIHMDALDFVREYGDQVDELYMGHVLEHIMPGDALASLALMYERLPAGAVVSAVTPDLDQMWTAYRDGEITNDELNFRYIYSYEQPSHHVWCYDQESLAELFRRAGFTDVEPIDPATWGPVFHKTGPEARWQCGVRATAGGAPPARLGAPPEVRRLSLDDLLDAVGAPAAPTDREVTAEETMLRRIELLRAAMTDQSAQRRALAQENDGLRRRLAEAEAVLGVTPEAAAEPVAAPRPADPPPAPVPTGTAPAAPTLRSRVRAQVKEILPPGTRRRDLARAALLTYREGVHSSQRVRDHWRATTRLTRSRWPRYADWLAGHRVSEAELEQQRREAHVATARTVVNVVVLPGPQPLNRTLRSLGAQSWPYWRATVCGASETGGDSRVGTLPDETDDVVALNRAVSEVESDFVVVLRAGDALEPDCLARVAMAARQDPLVDLISWDDDLLHEDGRRHDPRFRPVTWSPELLLSGNYLGRSFAIRRRRFLVTGGVRAGRGSASLWDLLLRCDLDAERVAHVPRVLGSLTVRTETVGPEAVAVLREHVERKGLPATVERAGADAVRLRWRLPDPPHVTVVIPTRHNRPMLSTCLPSLARTEYPSFDVVIVDNGGQSASNDAWYAEHRGSLDLQVIWWTTQPFNYSQVNNAAVEVARGEVLVFLNDDTEIVDPDWMTELVGWASQPGIGLAGLQLRGRDDSIQHGGVVVGLGGFADHLFEGMAPDSPSLLGPTTWYRNVSSVTGACVAVRRDVLDSVGGMDERFQLCGSDVALGLDLMIRRLRHVCSPFPVVRHLESATRGSSVPRRDFFTSFWKYSPLLFGGDPYFSPNLSLESREPALRPPAEPTSAQRVGPILGRDFTPYRNSSEEREARHMAQVCQALPVDEQAVLTLHRDNAAPFDVRSVNWFLPGLDSPFYGGINTALRIADKLARDHGVANRFVIYAAPNEDFIRSGLAAAFPALAGSEIVFYSLDSAASLEEVPYADASVATLWTTAYSVTHFPHTKRKFYLIQDYEPVFYPAGTLYALTEESYRLGLYGLCNTDNLLDVYRDEYGGRGMSFTPAVDRSVFHARWRHDRMEDYPATVFVYGRPGHWRNCWELAAPALEELKRRLGDGVRIVTAGAWAEGSGAEAEVKRLGLLDYRATGELYRRCDVGLTLTVSRHPSYLPLELMASGVPVVAFDNRWGHWLLRDGENSLLAKRTVDGLADRLERLCVDRELRARLSRQGLADIDARHSDWDKALDGIYPYLCDPEAAR